VREHHAQATQSNPRFPGWCPTAECETGYRSAELRVRRGNGDSHLTEFDALPSAVEGIAAQQIAFSEFPADAKANVYVEMKVFSVREVRYEPVFTSRTHVVITREVHPPNPMEPADNGAERTIISFLYQ